MQGIKLLLANATARRMHCKVEQLMRAALHIMTSLSLNEDARLPFGSILANILTFIIAKVRRTCV